MNFPGSSPANFRNVIDTHIEHLVADLSAQVEAEKEAAVTSARRHEREQARHDLAEELNQSVRRLRQSSKEEDVLAVLADSSSPFSERAAVFIFTDRDAEPVAWRGLAIEKVKISTAEAAAFVTAIETRDPVVAVGSAAEISEPLAAAAGGDSTGKVYLFPIVTRNTVVAILFAAGSVHASALELLSEAAGMQLHSLQPAAAAAAATAASSPLVSIAEVKPARAWDDLSAEEQALHLRAQRFARVKVAEYRLFQPDAVRIGREKGDVYSELRASIDSDREKYREEFVTASPTIVDYFHLELIRGLAHEDERLLGQGYPGPIV